MLASHHGHAASIELLLERGADPELCNDRGQTPLAGAAFKGLTEIMTLLLDHGAAVDGPDPDGRTPLMFAAMFDRLEAVDLLLRRGESPDRRDAGGATAAAVARAMGRAARPPSPEGNRGAGGHHRREDRARSRQA